MHINNVVVYKGGYSFFWDAQFYVYEGEISVLSDGMSKLQSWMKVGNVLYDVLKVFPSTIGSANHIIDVSFVQLRGEATVSVQHLVFNKANKQAGVIWAHVPALCDTTNLSVVVTIKTESVEC